MPTHASPVTLTCTECRSPFTLTATAYTRRRQVYDDRLLCQRCLADIWLRMRPYEKNKILERDISSRG
jgi:hypothetical protein